MLSEPGSEQVQAYFSEKRGGYWITNVCLVEALGVLKRNRKTLGEDTYLAKCYVLISYVRRRIQVVDSQLHDAEIWNETERVAKKHQLDVSDALQIVTVKNHYTKVFGGESKTILVTADEELAKAARIEGLRSWYCIKEHPPEH